MINIKKTKVNSKILKNKNIYKMVKRLIMNFILDSIENNPNDIILGEEIRVLEQAIQDIHPNQYDEVLDFIAYLIISTPNDSELGSKIRNLYNPLIKYLNVRRDFKTNND
jgi:hypothetical protein